MISLALSKVILNFTFSGNPDLFGMFGFDVNKVCLVISNIQLNCSVIKCSL